MARACANLGRLAEAVEWCEQAIAADKLNPAYQYLFATIQQEQGQNDAAAQSLTRALYLDPDFVLAHFALGNLRLAQGRRREAELHFDTALALLHAHPHDEPLPESEGLTAGRLTEIITSVRASLPRAAAGA
jgi:chemotaxis protein methyltransferase CheR